MLKLRNPELLPVIMLIGGLCFFASASAPADEPAPSERTQMFGKTAYRSANCVGCHKWHGAEGGGYGALVVSLRATSFDRSGIVEVIRCARPGTSMPYFEAKAWEEGRCYGGAKLSDFDPKMVPPFFANLTGREIQSVADYAIGVIRGKGAPAREECLAFRGGEAVKLCEPYAPGKSEPAK